MALRLIAKLRAEQVCLVALAFVVLLATAVQPTVLLGASSQFAAHGPQILKPLATNLVPIEHEYRIELTSSDLSAPLVLTERFVLAAPAGAYGAFLPHAMARRPYVRAHARALGITSRVASPRSPPLG
ncbi:MAG: hypothetical protein ACREQ4_16560 [Candidatus Binataceae bacterium]